MLRSNGTSIEGSNDKAKTQKTPLDSSCAETGATHKTVASNPHAERIGMQYKNLIGTEIMKRRDNLGWSQSDLAVKLQLAGLDIDRSQVSKIECRLVHVSDYQQLFFARVFKITINDLFPRVDPYEPLNAFLEKTMERKRLPIPRKKRKSAGRRREK